MVLVVGLRDLDELVVVVGEDSLVPIPVPVSR